MDKIVCQILAVGDFKQVQLFLYSQLFVYSSHKSRSEAAYAISSQSIDIWNKNLESNNIPRSRSLREFPLLLVGKW